MDEEETMTPMKDRDYAEMARDAIKDVRAIASALESIAKERDEAEVKLKELNIKDITGDWAVKELSGRIAELEGALQLIATPERSDGTLDKVETGLSSTLEMSRIVQSLRLRLARMEEALKKILAMTDQYEDCRDIGKVADTALALEEDSHE